MRIRVLDNPVTQDDLRRVQSGWTTELVKLQAQVRAAKLVSLGAMAVAAFAGFARACS